MDKCTPEGILEAYKAKPINLEALFSGANPFEEADGVSNEEFAGYSSVLNENCSAAAMSRNFSCSKSIGIGIE